MGIHSVNWFGTEDNMTEYTNLSEAFLSAAENTNVGIRFFKGKDNEYRETYAEILQKG